MALRLIIAGNKEQLLSRGGEQRCGAKSSWYAARSSSAVRSPADYDKVLAAARAYFQRRLFSCERGLRAADDALPLKLRWVLTSVCRGDGFTPYRANIKIGGIQDDPPHQHHQAA